jgi:hypothetical protein
MVFLNTTTQWNVSLTMLLLPGLGMGRFLKILMGRYKDFLIR